MRSLDTTVAIDHLRGQAAARQLLDRLLEDRVRILVSEVLRFEILAGLRPGESERTERLFAGLDVVPVTEQVSRAAADLARRYRSSHSGIDAADYLIAATATLFDAPLLTTNVRHFPMFEGLEPPY